MVERVPQPARLATRRAAGTLDARWQLAAILLVAALLRLPTLTAQSLWYDEAVTAVRVLHASLGATLSAVARVENTPPLYYLLEWGSTRVLGTGVFALRLLSAAAGIASVAVAWQIGRELGSRRTAVVLAAIVATNPLFVWYSQEARAYELLVLLSSAAFLMFLRALRRPGAAAYGGWAALSALALLTHYFAGFLFVAEAALLLVAAGGRDRRLWAAVGAVAAVCAALAPLASAQGGHGTNWIGQWPLASRVEALAQYYLLGESGRPLGRAALVLAALPLIASLALVHRLGVRERSDALVCAIVGGFAILAPLALALAGADYLAPRYLIAAYIPLTAALALLLTTRASVPGTVLAALVCASNLIVLAAVATRPQLQRGDWHGVARRLPPAPAGRAVVIAVIGGLPLQYYEPRLQGVSGSRTPPVAEIDLIGYPPLRRRVARPPVRGFVLAGRTSIHGIALLRFRAAAPVALEVRRLLAHRPAAVPTEVLAAGS